MPTQPMDLGNGLTDQQSSPPPPAQQNVQAPPVHTGGLFHSVLSALGGASTPSYSVDDSGKMQTTQTPNTPGTQWKNIIAGALTGMAAGAQAGSEARPGAQGWAGAGAGFQAVRAHDQQQDLLKRAQAQQEFNTKQQKMVQDANIAHLNQQTVKSQFDMKQAGVEATDKAVDRFNSMQGLVASDPNNREVFSAKSFDEIVQAAQVDPKLIQLQTSGRLRIMAAPDGTVHAYEVNPAWSEAKTDKPVVLQQPVFDNGKISHKTVEIPAGAITNATALSLGQTFQNQENEMSLKAMQLGNQSKVQQSEIAKNYAEATKTQEEIKQLREFGNLTDDFGNKINAPAGGVKEYNKVKDSFKKNADNLSQTEQTFKQFKDIISTPDDKLTGAQSVVGLFNAIGISAEPLKGKGFRINNNTVQEHVQARGLGEKAYNLFANLKNGEIVTPQQLKDYATIAMNARRDAYITNYNQAVASGVNGSFLLPKGNGQQIDPNTAQIFFVLAGNDKDKARAAATKSGWKF